MRIIIREKNGYAVLYSHLYKEMTCALLHIMHRII